MRIPCVLQPASEFLAFFSQRCLLNLAAPHFDSTIHVCLDKMQRAARELGRALQAVWQDTRTVFCRFEPRRSALDGMKTVLNHFPVAGMVLHGQYFLCRYIVFYYWVQQARASTQARKHATTQPPKLASTPRHLPSDVHASTHASTQARPTQPRNHATTKKNPKKHTTTRPGTYPPM